MVLLKKWLFQLKYLFKISKIYRSVESRDSIENSKLQIQMVPTNMYMFQIILGLLLNHHLWPNLIVFFYLIFKIYISGKMKRNILFFQEIYLLAKIFPIKLHVDLNQILEIVCYNLGFNKKPCMHFKPTLQIRDGILSF